MTGQLQTRLFRFQDDYPELCEWWRAREAHGWTYVPASSLPQTGFVAFDDAHKYGAVFLYLGESGWRWVEWLTTNPKAPLRRRVLAIDLLVKRAIATAVESGAQNIVTSLNNENLIDVFEANGFKKGGGGMTDMIWRAAP